MCLHIIQKATILSILTALVIPQMESACSWWQNWDGKYVTINQGTLCGSLMKSLSGRTFHAYRGIPYAQPPVGRLRFKPPLPATRWEGILDATNDVPSCIQLQVVIFNTFGTEDCLYLNVYTPKLDIPKNETGLDVIVWLHAGDFYFGTSSTRMYHPKHILNKDVILVTLNYRLAALGFLSTGDDEAPGNYGLKDQREALKWVRDNIASFGGNPGSVTLAGYSSGSSSVHFHLLSPSSAGLFHRAISMDGTAITPTAWTRNPLEQAKKQAEIVHCPTEPTSSMIQCLREINVDTLTKSMLQLFEWWLAPGPGLTPVKEIKTEKNPEPFLVEEPLQSMRTGNFQKVPWLIGGTSQPGLIFTSAIHSLKMLQSQIDESWKSFIPRVLVLNFSVPESKVNELFNNLTEYYVGNMTHYSNKIFNKITKLASDAIFIFPNQKTVQLHSRAGHKPIYLYNMAYRGLYSINLLMTLRNLGVSHADTTFYLFPARFVYPPGHQDLEFREMLLTMWVNFAKYGNPTPPQETGNEIVDELKWLPVGNVTLEDKHIRYLNIGQVITSPTSEGFLDLGLGVVKLNMAVDLYKDRMDFWNSLPLYQNCLENCTIT